MLYLSIVLGKLPDAKKEAMVAEAHRRVLFVEPNPGQQKIFAAVLKPEENKWVLKFSSSAEDALAVIAQAPPDIIITANKLPDRTGLELLEELVQKAPEVIRLLLIDAEEKHSMRSAVSAAQQTLIKPIELKPLITQINRALALRNLVRNPKILELLGGKDALPPLPRIFQELSRKLNDPNASLTQIGEMIAQDIVLSSKILKLANSALFSLRVPAQNVTHAVSLLGASAVSTLVFNQSVFTSFKGNAANEAFFEQLNQHSIECATLTSKILKSWGATRQVIDKSVFCGIAHDLGKMILARFAPDKWVEVLAEVKKGERTDIEIEQALLGTTHAELTAYLLTIWGFPNDQIISIVFHHQPSRINDNEFGLLCALHIAENCSTPKPQKENFDWEYLENNRLTKEDIEGYKMMLHEDE